MGRGRQLFWKCEFRDEREQNTDGDGESNTSTAERAIFAEITSSGVRPDAGQQTVSGQDAHVERGRAWGATIGGGAAAERAIIAAGEQFYARRAEVPRGACERPKWEAVETVDGGRGVYE